MNFLKSLATVVVLAVTLPTLAQEAVIRKNLGERIPQLQKIDEVSKSPMPGLWEIRINGTDIFYTDAEGNYLIQGSLIDTRARRNLTESLSAIAVLDADLPVPAPAPTPTSAKR